MSTVAELIDRISRNWLFHPDDQPTRFTLDGAITDSATTLTYDASYLTAEELELLGSGTLLEVDSELIIAGTVDESARTISGCTRGAQGTTAAAHADDAVVYVAPTFTRKAVFDAVADSVMSLWPELYKVSQTTELTINTGSPTEVPAAVEMPLWFWHRSGSDASDWRKLPVQFFDHAPWSDTGKAITVPAGGSGYLIYRERFTRPTAEADDLQTDAGIDLEWERLVEIASVSHLVAARDVERLTLEHLTEQLASEGVPVGAASQVRDSLIRYEEFLRDKAQRALRSRYKMPIHRNGLFTS